jgi:hypothetical protein
LRVEGNSRQFSECVLPELIEVWLSRQRRMVVGEIVREHPLNDPLPPLVVLREDASAIRTGLTQRELRWDLQFLPWVEDEGRDPASNGRPRQIVSDLEGAATGLADAGEIRRRHVELYRHPAGQQEIGIGTLDPKTEGLRRARFRDRPQRQLRPFRSVGQKAECPDAVGEACQRHPRIADQMLLARQHGSRMCHQPRVDLVTRRRRGGIQRAVGPSIEGRDDFGRQHEPQPPSLSEVLLHQDVEVILPKHILEGDLLARSFQSRASLENQRIRRHEPFGRIIVQEAAGCG